MCSTILKITGNFYQPYPVIFHIGQDTYSSHYVVYLKTPYSWICANDQLLKKGGQIIVKIFIYVNLYVFIRKKKIQEPYQPEANTKHI